MGLSTTEAQQFYNSKLADRIQSGGLGGQQLRNTTQREKNMRVPQSSGMNINEAEQEEINSTQATQQQSQATIQQQSRVIQQQLKQIEIDIAIAHSELIDFYRMIWSQAVPISTTGAATIVEVATGGTVGIIATLFAIMVRFLWFFLQSPKTKLWLRLKTMKQAIVSSLISMIPVIGTLLQPDLVSTAVVTPLQTTKKIREIKATLEQKKKEKKQLEGQQTQLMRMLNTL